jgi:hypothetical protein
MLWTLSMQSASAGTPRAASATVARTGPAGNSTVRQSAVATNGQGGYSAHSTLTGPAGKTATRQQSGSYNPATQSYNRSGTTTGPSGAQSNFSTSLQKTSNGYDRTATRTGPNGNSATSTKNVTVTPNN